MKNKQINLSIQSVTPDFPLTGGLFSREIRKLKAIIFFNNQYDTVDQHPHSHIMLKTH